MVPTLLWLLLLLLDELLRRLGGLVSVVDSTDDAFFALLSLLLVEPFVLLDLDLREWLLASDMLFVEDLFGEEVSSQLLLDDRLFGDLLELLDEPSSELLFEDRRLGVPSDLHFEERRLGPPSELLLEESRLGELRDRRFAGFSSF